jgi:aldehyde dehydrogenase (NAD+)
MKQSVNSILKALELQSLESGASTGRSFLNAGGALLESYSPVDGALIGSVTQASHTDYEHVMASAVSAYREWREVPAPRRGELVRLLSQEFRRLKEPLGQLVSYEMGKSLQEGLGEVQEIIDICDFAVGLSRQLYGLTMHSERPGHRMYEQWHPLGVVGVISAFNFPVAVWSWNTMIAWVCGNACVWKPSEKTPLTALACQKITARVLEAYGAPEGLSGLVVGDARVGEWLSQDQRVPLVSATGSTRMGKAVAAAVAGRLGRSLLELGGNNAIVVSSEADLKLVTIGAVFGAVGTAGQRCTSTRRLIVHESVYAEMTRSLVSAYAQLRIGDPLDANHHVGPLIDLQAVRAYTEAIEKAREQGGRVLVGGAVCEGEGFESGCYVKPCVIEIAADAPIVMHETFAPILYIHSYKELGEAIQIQNSVPQGLSSAMFTRNLLEAEQFLCASGSDCGIANINIGTSGAEIGGAFGGEKETGGGRESGTDSWKAYMRRQTNTINYTDRLPLAQGIRFDLG